MSTAPPPPPPLDEPTKAAPEVRAPQESPFSKAISDAYRAELASYSANLNAGHYGPPEDEDSKSDWKEDKDDARKRMRSLRDSRSKQKLEAAKISDASHNNRSECPSTSYSKSKEAPSRKTSHKRNSSSWRRSRVSSTKSKEATTVEGILDAFRAVVNKVPTVLWLPSLEGEEEDGADGTNVDVEEDGHRKKKFFNVLLADQTWKGEEFVVYTEYKDSDGIGFTCNACKRNISCKVR